MSEVECDWHQADGAMPTLDPYRLVGIDIEPHRDKANPRRSE